jgi:hypothetical protein
MSITEEEDYLRDKGKKCLSMKKEVTGTVITNIEAEDTDIINELKKNKKR